VDWSGLLFAVLLCPESLAIGVHPHGRRLFKETHDGLITCVKVMFVRPSARTSADADYIGAAEREATAVSFAPVRRR
jgi:hypothetical protein